MKILLIYPGTRHSTYDVALGYHEALEALGHSVLAYNFHNYLDYHAGAIEHWKEHNAEFRPDEAQRIDMWMRWASEPLIIHIVEHAPDLILIVSGLTVHAHTYRLMGKFNIPKAVIFTECPYIDDKQAEILTEGFVHMAFVNDKNSVQAIQDKTGKPAVYLPHSYAPLRHYPGATDEAHQTDIYFHGTWWPERGQLFDCMLNGLNDDYKIRVVGVGWEGGAGHMQHVTPNAELAEWYRGARVALNHHRTVQGIGEQNPKHIPNGAAWSIGPRAYEIAACGAFQLCDATRPELKEVFGDTVATYADADDLRAKVVYYLGHEDERDAMARAAFERVAPCSFQARAAEILMPAVEEWL